MGCICISMLIKDGWLMFSVHMWKSVFLRSTVNKPMSAHKNVCVCVVFTQACLCAWAMPRPGLGGLTEISCKRITDHASLAYWFTAKNTYTYTPNLLLCCSVLSVCLSLTRSFRHTVVHLHHMWVSIFISGFTWHSSGQSRLSLRQTRRRRNACAFRESPRLDQTHRF